MIGTDEKCQREGGAVGGAVGDEANGCPVPGTTGDRAAELHRQARLADDLFDRVVAIKQTLPSTGDLEGWRGPAADLFAAAVDEQQALLGREVYRLESVRSSLRSAATVAEVEALARGGLP